MPAQLEARRFEIALYIGIKCRSEPHRESTFMPLQVLASSFRRDGLSITPYVSWNGIVRLVFGTDTAGCDRH